MAEEESRLIEEEYRPPLAEKLIPKKPSRLCPSGIQTFNIAQQTDKTGVSGERALIEGVVLPPGQCMGPWL